MELLFAFLNSLVPVPLQPVLSSSSNPQPPARCWEPRPASHYNRKAADLLPERIIRYFLEKRTAEVALVIVNKAQAGVLKRAERLSVPSLILTAQDFADGKALEILHQYHIDFIVLAGFLLKVPDAILHDYPNKIVNIHPALLPKFGGKGMYGSRVHQAVIASHEKESGITIHYINERYDEGNTIFQATCPVLPTDTPDTLAIRVHQLEYEYFPRVIEATILGKNLSI